jgi:hypothetical protein
VSNLINLFSQAWFGSLLGILGLVSAVYFYWRSKRVARLAFQRDTVTLLGGPDAAFPDEIEIKFAGMPISRVTAETIVLWNAGNTTVGGSQIVAADPLRFDLKCGDILKTRVLKVTREVNAITLRPLSESKNTVEITFDYLDPDDGIAFEILHSGARRDLKIHGTLRAMPGGIRDFGRANAFSHRRRGNLPFPRRGMNALLVMAMCVGLAMAAFGLFRTQIHTWFPSLRESNRPDSDSLRFAFVVAGLLYALMPALLFWVRRRRYPTCLHTEQSDEEAKR